MRHRHKHRILRTTYLIAVILFCFLLMQYIMAGSERLLALIASFAFGLVLLVGYEVIIIRRLKDPELVFNSLTQVYIGSVAVGGAVIVLLAHALFGMPLDTGLYVLPAAIIVLLGATWRKFDRVLKRRVA